MLRLHTALCIAASFFFLTAAIAADKPNLTGTWKMNPAKSDIGSNAIKSRVDTIEHKDPQLKITTTQDDENGTNTVVRDYVTDGREMTHTILGGERKAPRIGTVMSSSLKRRWRTATTRSDRWALADDHKSIRIDRELSNAPGRPQRVVLEKQ